MSSQTTSVVFSCAQQSNILKDLFGNLFDFVVIAGVDNTKIEAHRKVLSASNDFFEAMFRSNLREAKTNEVEFKDFDGSTTKSLINFIYTGLIDINIETVQSLLEAAEFLQMKTLVTACCEFIGKQLDISNCLAIVLFADYYGHTDLQSTSYSFACKHFYKVWMNDEFCQLNVEQLNRLLSSDHLVTCSEKEVFHSILAWIKYDEKNRNESLSKVMSNVRFPLLGPKYIIEIRQTLSQSMEWYRVMSSWLQWHFSPETRSTYPPEQTKPRNPLRAPQRLIGGFHDSDEDSFDDFSNGNSPDNDDESMDYGTIGSNETSDDSCFAFSEENDEPFDGNEPDDYNDSCDYDLNEETDECPDNDYDPDKDEFIDDNDVCNEPDDYFDNSDYDLNEETDECPDNDYDPDKDEFIDDNDVCNEPDDFIDNCANELPDEVDERPDPDFYDDEQFLDLSSQEDVNYDDYTDHDYYD